MFGGDVVLVVAGSLCRVEQQRGRTVVAVRDLTNASMELGAVSLRRIEAVDLTNASRVWKCKKMRR